jgi:hypothetical protein
MKYWLFNSLLVQNRYAGRIAARQNLNVVRIYVDP